MFLVSDVNKEEIDSENGTGQHLRSLFPSCFPGMTPQRLWSLKSSPRASLVQIPVSDGKGNFLIFIYDEKRVRCC